LAKHPISDEKSWTIDGVTPNARELILASVVALFLFVSFQRQLFNPVWPNRLTLIVAIAVILLLLAALPIWHWHGDIGGRMHGHAIWDGGHVH
jgi:hypothetical protein